MPLIYISYIRKFHEVSFIQFKINILFHWVMCNYALNYSNHNCSFCKHVKWSFFLLNKLNHMSMCINSFEKYIMYKNQLILDKLKKINVTLIYLNQ